MPTDIHGHAGKNSLQEALGAVFESASGKYFADEPNNDSGMLRRHFLSLAVLLSRLVLLVFYARAFVKPVNAVHKVVERRNAGEITDGESGDDSQYRIVSEFFAPAVDRYFEV
jgi:hypothetical protein